MNNTFKFSISFLLIAVLALVGCKKEEYTFGQMKTPSSLAITTTIAGVDNSNPAGNGTGIVSMTVKATNALTYKFDFGDGNIQMIPSGVVNYKYTTPGTSDYNVTVTAIGTGGIVSTISKTITVYVAFTIPTDIVQNLTGGSSKIWMCDRNADAHFGVGPSDAFSPIWYAAGANSRSADGFYDDEVTFSKDVNNNVSLNLDNKGTTFVLGAALSYYGLSGAEGQYPIANQGIKKLAFMNATSASTTANSTRIQFTVPGNGLVLIGMGSSTYEILSLTSTTMTLRTIGADGNSWYQKLKVK